jgi:hypothetical protein
VPRSRQRSSGSPRGAARPALTRELRQLGDAFLTLGGHPAQAVGEREQRLNTLSEEQENRRRRQEQDRQHCLVRCEAVALEQQDEHDGGADRDERQPANEPDEAANQPTETGELIRRDRDPRHPAGRYPCCAESQSVATFSLRRLTVSPAGHSQ